MRSIGCCSEPNSNINGLTIIIICLSDWVMRPFIYHFVLFEGNYQNVHLLGQKRQKI